MDRSWKNHTGHNEQPKQGVPPPGRTGVKKERATKEDSRYIIFYTFDCEDDQEDRDS